MAIQFVLTNQVTAVNGVSYGWPNYPNGISKSVPCRSVIAGGYFWRVPVTLGNRLISYNYFVALDAVKPTADSVKVLRVKDALDANTEYEFAVLDADGVSSDTFIDDCNGCCGDTPVMPTVTIPPPILQSAPNSVDDSENTFIFAFPVNPLSLKYAIPYPWFNSVGPVTPYVPGSITTVGAFVTWANTNWGDYGTWSSPAANVVQLVSAPGDTIYVELAGMEVSLTPAPWCFDFTAFSPPAAVNGVKFGTSSTIAFSPLMLTVSNQADLINRLTALMPKAVFVSASGSLQITSYQAQPILYYDTTLVATAASGAC